MQEIINKYLFLDIETVPQFKTFDEYSERMQNLWVKKFKQITKSEDYEKEAILNINQAGIYSEFGKIICISIGYITEIDGIDGVKVYQMKTKSYYGDDETKLLNEFLETEKFPYIVAHNGREFDLPYITRRMMINGIKPPTRFFKTQSQKAWHDSCKFLIDTIDLWKFFGENKNSSGLELIAAVMDVETSKDDIDGSQVYSVYYEDKDLERIKVYCEKDVKTLANVFLKLKGINSQLLS